MRSMILASASLITASLCITPPAPAQDLILLCSGIGQERTEEEANFPHTLKMVYAAPDGRFLGNVRTVIRSADAEVVDTTCPGPWLLANLPEGSYEVTAIFEGKSKTGRVRVREGVTKAVMTF